jgi:hypothetical protein
VVNTFSKAASVRWSCNRERAWDKVSREREQQQQSGDQAMHTFCGSKT